MSKDMQQSRMKSYKFKMSVEPESISYGVSEYINFEVREVVKDGKQIGEYHVKMINSSKLNEAVLFFKRNLGGDCEIGLIDPEMTLNLEYPIYIKIGGLIAVEDMDEAFNDMDKSLSEFKR